MGDEKTESDAVNQDGDDSDSKAISEMKKPIGRAHNIHSYRRHDNTAEEEEQEERTILPPTSTRLSRRLKKISEMSTGESALAATENTITEDQEIASTTNTPSSSASSSRY